MKIYSWWPFCDNSSFKELEKGICTQLSVKSFLKIIYFRKQNAEPLCTTRKKMHNN